MMDFEKNEFDFLTDDLKGDPKGCLKPERLQESIRELEGEVRWNQTNAELYFQLGVFYGCLKDDVNAVTFQRQPSMARRSSWIPG